LGKNRKTLVTREDVLKRSGSEYEALVAIAKEARRLNAVPGLRLKEDEKAIPKAVENFAAGLVQYEVDGARPGERPARESEKKAAAGKPKRRRKTEKVK
jgi:DNA-directed RNA polymerase subunit K/omega